MKDRILLLLSLLFTVLTPEFAPAQVQDKIDWPQFLSRHDLVWEESPKVWHEGAFIGNVFWAR